MAKKVREICFTYCSPKFEILFTSRKRFFVFDGGRGGGKDHSIGRFILESMAQYECRVMVCRELQTSIKDSNHRLLKDLIHDHDLGDIFEVTEAEIRCKLTGSVCIFKGLKHNVDSIKSIEGIDICWVNEAQTISDDSLDYLVPTIRAPNSIIIFSLNPRYKTDPVYTRFILANRGDVERVQINLPDNEFASQTLIDESDYLKATDPEKWEWLYGGQCVGDQEMSLISALDLQESRARLPQVDTNLAICAGLDVSGLGNDWTVLIRRRGAEILSIDRIQKADVPQVANWAKELFIQKPWDRLIVDASGSSGVYDLLQQWARGHQACEVLRFLGGQKATKPHLYSNRRTESWVLMRDWIRERGKLPNDECFDIIPRQLYKITGGEQIALLPKELLGKSPDEADALAMSCCLSDAKRPNMVQPSGFWG